MNNWKALRRAWSLSLEGKDRIAERFLRQYKDMFEEQTEMGLSSQIFNFALFFVAPSHYNKTIPVFELIKKIQDSNLEEYISLPPTGFQSIRQAFRSATSI